MKRYNEFITEGLLAAMKPKPKDDILDSLMKLDIFPRIKAIRKNEISDDYLPKYEEIEEALSKVPDAEKIMKIISFRLDYDLLPKGDLIFKGSLECSDCGLTSLPDNLTISGTLWCTSNELTKLPKGLEIGLSLWCNNNNLTELPSDLKVGGALHCTNNLLTSLPNDLDVNGGLNCSYNKLTELPKGLNVRGDVMCMGNSVILELPGDAKIGGDFINI